MDSLQKRSFHSCSCYLVFVQLCKGGELHIGFDSEETERTAYTYGDIGRIAICMLQLADIMHSLGIVHCAKSLLSDSATASIAPCKRPEFLTFGHEGSLIICFFSAVENTRSHV
jgi:hypothetical protein